MKSKTPVQAAVMRRRFKMEKHPILATVFYNDGDDQIEIIPFDGKDNPELAAAEALRYGVQCGYDHVGVSDVFDAGFGNDYWHISNGLVKTGVSHQYSHPDFDDAKVVDYYNQIVESGRVVSAPENIESGLYDPWAGSKPKPYTMYTKDMNFYDFSLMKLRETPFQAKALLKAGRMDPKMQMAWERSRMNKENITGNPSAFTSEMLHLLPEEYRPKSLRINRNGLNINAQAVIDGNLIERSWREDSKGFYKYGAPRDAEIAGRLVDDYLADRIKKLYDDLPKN